MIKPTIISVSQLNFYVKSLLDNDSRLSQIFVTGEISNLTDHYRSGHIYLSLKDQNSVIRAVMFSGFASRLRFKPQEGMKVIVRGRVTVYEPTGQYQLYIEDMQPDGIGALSLAYEQLKEKLEKEGLFSQAHKKPLPRFPRSVGIITSPTGAALQDILNIISRRFPSVEIVMCPVLVQGENAPAQLCQAIRKFSQTKVSDVVIIGRGGGSIEDLWAFNNEQLAYEIFNCEVPVISAVGHETDFTICDFVSDLRAPTPSAAAELCVPDKEELKFYLSSQKQYLSSLLERKIKANSDRTLLQKERLNKNSPLNTCQDRHNTLRVLEKRMENSVNKIYHNNNEAIVKLSSMLEGLNPVSVLNRGYSIALKDNKPVASVNDVSRDDVLNIKVSDGDFSVKVI